MGGVGGGREGGGEARGARGAISGGFSRRGVSKVF